MEFKDRFQELLDEQNINARRLCEIINIDHTSIYNYLHGGFPNIKNAVKIANYFNCTLNHLFGIDYLPNEYIFFNYYDASLFYDRYNKLLKETNKSNYKVSKDLNIAYSTYLRWKNGSEPKPETLIRLARYFNVNIDYLIGRSNTD